jgi:biopolymer transport protein ExbD
VIARRRPVAKSIGLNLTPMIDVVFQLLIYFLLGTSFALGEELYRLDLPAARDRSGERGAARLLEGPIMIHVTSIGEGPADCRVRVEPEWIAAQDPRGLEAALRGAIVSPGNPEGVLVRSQPMLIAADPETRWEHAVLVFDLIVRSGFTHVGFAETSAESGSVRP